MNLPGIRLVAFAIITMAGAAAQGATESGGPLQPEDIKWGAAPPNIPAGAELVVLAGDPAKTGPVTMRLKMPAGYAIAPHWHPTDERVTIISGELGLGMGDTLDEQASTVLRAGGYVVALAKMNHFAWTKSGAVVQIDLMGPFEITYVNPADDPSKPQK